jgi:succinate dehydrogenase/fumarate reductase flavoprotein subunit
VFSPLNRNTEYKVNPLELEDYIRQVNYNFIGIHKVKSKIERAIELIRFAREGAVPLLVASNPHELMRAIEVQNIIEISELHAQSSLLRTESRLVPVHYREDYPELDPKWDNKIVTVKKIDNEIKYDIEDLNYRGGRRVFNLNYGPKIDYKYCNGCGDCYETVRWMFSGGMKKSKCLS